MDKSFVFATPLEEKGKCQITWCNNSIKVFDFTAGQNIPKSKGGSNNRPGNPRGSPMTSISFCVADL